MAKKLVRFDWAMKRLLRHKANFDILEGFLTELLGQEVTIKQILDSESNKETEDDKHNRVDILVENSKNELVIIEVQNSNELDEWIYFFKNAEIKSGFSAKGLKEVNERLDEMKLNEQDAKAYKKYLKNLRDIASDQYTKMVDAQDLIDQALSKKEIENVMRLHNKGMSHNEIAELLAITVDRVQQIIDNK